ncbi:hypothetical protein RRG08_020754 [Elysia crispata]|uniref:Uncharacterized protein n=1 Tax=Elysia crispata TaxID=231223 RepID=A0AAE1E5A8_9GAST|nr:hypothetical protein RRG08_020754 [Elysia crispata]
MSILKPPRYRACKIEFCDVCISEGLGEELWAPSCQLLSVRTRLRITSEITLLWVGFIKNLNLQNMKSILDPPTQSSEAQSVPDLSQTWWCSCKYRKEYWRCSTVSVGHPCLIAGASLPPPPPVVPSLIPDPGLSPALCLPDRTPAIH